MNTFVILLSLLGLAAAQFNRPMGGVNGNEGFFNNGDRKSSTVPPNDVPPPPPHNSGNFGGNFGGNVGNQGLSQSSTSPPIHPQNPAGPPQLAPVSGNNANSDNFGKSSGEMNGFGATDYNGGGPDVISNRGNNQNSGEQKVGGFYGGQAVNGIGADQPSGVNRETFGPARIGGAHFTANDLKRADANEVSNLGASTSAVVGVVFAVLIVIGIFALVAVFLVRQRRQSRVVMGSV